MGVLVGNRANVDIVLDCLDPGRLAGFWSAALRYRIAGSKQEYVALVSEDRTNPPLVLQRVPEPKEAKNRMHLDIVTDDVEKEAARLEDLGARRFVNQPPDADWIVMADPEGNEFCVCPGLST